GGFNPYSEVTDNVNWPTGLAATILSSDDAYTYVIDNAGARPWNRDVPDARLLTQIAEQTGVQPDCVARCGECNDHDGSSSRFTMTASSASQPDDWDDGLWIGHTIENLNDGSTCTITSNTAETITCAGGLSGGNTWDDGEYYFIHDSHEKSGDVQVPEKGWPYYDPGTPLPDSDHDGIPNTWENSHGLDLNNPADGNLDRNGDGYTNIEEYINSLIPMPNN
ncbi:hypothetical protein ACFLZ9_01625, partial [Patescibacteria group bacterium]